MSHRQLADQEGHRWDVEEEGPLNDREGPDDGTTRHQLRFRRDNGEERVRSAPRGLDQLADTELRALLDERDPRTVGRGPDTSANETGGYGDAID